MVYVQLIIIHAYYFGVRNVYVYMQFNIYVIYFWNSNQC